MLAAIVQKPLLALLVIVLGFNLVQRRHLNHGEKKRFASLGIAGLLLILVAGSAAVDRLRGSDWILLFPLAISGFLAYGYRHRLFLFRRSCSECGRPLELKQVLFYDKSHCTLCRIPKNVEEVEWSEWRAQQEAVLCFIHVDSRLLLIHKKKGLGAGKISAPGGRIEPGESALEAAIRETQEEIGVTPISPEKRGELSFVFADGLTLHGSVFFSQAFEGEPIETDEADPFWCKVDEIPYDRMWEDDDRWLPLVLKGKNFTGRFIYEGETIVSESVTTDENWSMT